MGPQISSDFQSPTTPAPQIPEIQEPKYTMNWLGLQTLFVIGISLIP